jgi:hypothetical protein
MQSEPVWPKNKTTMENKWVHIYTSGDFFKAELLRQALVENGVEAVLLNKKDSSYQFGEVRVMVAERDFATATEIIIQENLDI